MQNPHIRKAGVGKPWKVSSNLLPEITDDKFSNSPVVTTNIVKGGLISKDPNAVKYGLHNVARYSGPFGGARGPEKKEKC